MIFKKPDVGEFIRLKTTDERFNINPKGIFKVIERVEYPFEVVVDSNDGMFYISKSEIGEILTKENHPELYL